MPKDVDFRKWCLIAAAALALIAVMVALLLRRELPSATTEPPTTASAGTEAPLYCRLSVWEGKLARFAPDAPATAAPEEVYEVWIAALPEEERARLTTGIDIPDEDTLATLLEDYTY